MNRKLCLILELYESEGNKREAFVFGPLSSSDRCVVAIIHDHINPLMMNIDPLRRQHKVAVSARRVGKVGMKE